MTNRLGFRYDVYAGGRLYASYQSSGKAKACLMRIFIGAGGGVGGVSSSLHLLRYGYFVWKRDQYIRSIPRLELPS